MYSLRQSLHIESGRGEPLPQVFKTLPTRFLRGQFALVCAAPGAGKSAFVLTYVLKAGVPTLYFSPDSDAFTQTSRAESILTGCSTQEAQQRYKNGQLTDAADQLPVKFVYESPMLWGRVTEIMDAFAQAFGGFPALVVLDNITNLRAESDVEDPFEGLESLMDVIHGKARETGSAFIGLHHVTGSHNGAADPVSQAGIKNQIGRVPEVILTLHQAKSEFGPDLLNVSTVKNRAGVADASGQTFISLAFDGNTMSIRDLT